jgi:hypothetical protein
VSHKLFSNRTARWPFLLFWLIFSVAASGQDNKPSTPPPGITYTNYQMPSIPWSIHVVKVDRGNRALEIHSMHAGGGALGLSALSEQIALVNPALGRPVAAINGDFYQRDKAYAGDPRGAQIINNEVISAPSGGAVFWTDVLGDPHLTNVVSLFQVTWPDGSVTSCGLNEDRRTNAATLYTPAIGPSTHTTNGWDLVLERDGGNPWLPLKMGKTYRARVREIHEGGNARLGSEEMALSLGPPARVILSNIKTGAVVTISTGSSPSLRGAKTAIGGGPALLRNGKRLKIQPPGAAEVYEFGSMLERHPRTAIGWNEQAFFLVVVDGRQKELSVGMTLDELSSYLLKLGCTDAMALDGGGSATLWCDGEVRNSPCDGRERGIANSLVVTLKNSGTSQGNVHAPNKTE